jgi:hypothetical protein
MTSWPDPRIKSEGRFVPAIHVYLAVPRKQDVDARNKCGHDGF